MSPYCSIHILTFGPAPSFSSRSFENNLNTYKRLAIKLPDSQIPKVGDVAVRHVPASGNAWVLLWPGCPSALASSGLGSQETTLRPADPFLLPPPTWATRLFSSGARAPRSALTLRLQGAAG